MSLTFECPTCGARLQADDEMAGRRMRCSRCKAVVLAPGAHAAPPESEPEPEPPTHEPGAADRDREPVPDSRPRRRRRRPEPPPPRGRSPGFVVAAVLGVLFLGALACCGGGYFLLPGENWHRYESAEGGFAVDLPAPAKKDMPVPGFKPEPGQRVEGTVLWKRGEIYAVMYMDIPPAAQRLATDEAILDAAVKEMRNDPECRTMRAEPVRVSGFTAREVEYTYSDGGTYSGRLVVADRRFYILLSGGRFVRPGNANVRRFIDSFEVTDPALRGGAAFDLRQKEEEAQRAAERLAAAERAAKEAAWRQAQNEAFRTAAHDGPKPGDPRVLSQRAGDIIHLSLDEAVPGGIGEWGRTRPLLKAAAHGPGVRGKAAFIKKGTQTQNITVYRDALPRRPGVSIYAEPEYPIPQGLKGFTLSGWYRSRNRSFDLFKVSIPTTPRSGIREWTDVRVRVEQNSIVVSSHAKGKSTEVPAPRPADDKWHHVAVVFDQTGQDALVSVYIEGKKAAGGTGVKTRLLYSSVSIGSPQAGADWHPLTDSEGRPTATAADDFVGAIDECCVIDGPLGAPDVGKLAGLAPLTEEELPAFGRKPRTPFPVPDPRQFAGLRAYFPCDELDGTDTADVVGGKLTMQAAKPERVAGPRGAALRATGGGTAFTRSDSALRAQLGPAPLTVGKARPFTVAFWVRVEADKPQPALLAFGSEARAGRRWFFVVANQGSKGSVGFQLALPGAKPGEANGPKGAQEGFKPGEWAHVAVARDAKGKFRLAVNGEAVEVAGEYDEALPFGEFHLGYGQQSAPGKPAGQEPFTVAYDEFCIFDRDLSDDELAALAGQKPLPKK